MVLHQGSTFLGITVARDKKALSAMSLTAVMRRMDVKAVPHGFRSSFRDWVGDRTNFPRDLAKVALAHVIANKKEEAYRRSDAIERRREMMDAWSAFIGGCNASMAASMNLPVELKPKRATIATGLLK